MDVLREKLTVTGSSWISPRQATDWNQFVLLSLLSALWAFRIGKQTHLRPEMGAVLWPVLTELA